MAEEKGKQKTGHRNVLELAVYVQLVSILLKENQT